MLIKLEKLKLIHILYQLDEKNLEERPEVENLLGIYSSLNKQSLKDTINDFSGKNFSDFKEKLADLVVEKILPISNEINKLKKNNEYIDSILKKGGDKANEIASKKILEIKKIIRFLIYYSI